LKRKVSLNIEGKFNVTYPVCKFVYFTHNVESRNNNSKVVVTTIAKTTRISTL
jgi:hypothetical protein